MLSYCWKHKRVIAGIIWKCFAATMFIIGTVSFACFILEEALQRRSFAISPLIMNRMWERAETEIARHEPKIRRDLALLKRFASMNPITGTSFLSYAYAEEESFASTKSFVQYMAKQERKASKLNALRGR